MSVGLRRGLADLACRAVQAALPSSMQSWGRAVRCETAGIADDTRALPFALDSLCGLMPRALAFHLLRPFAPLGGAGAPFSEGSTVMTIFDATMRRPRALGLAYMAVADAPARYLGVNVGALGIAVAVRIGRRVSVAERPFVEADGVRPARASAVAIDELRNGAVESERRLVALDI